MLRRWARTEEAGHTKTPTSTCNTEDNRTAFPCICAPCTAWTAEEGPRSSTCFSLSFPFFACNVTGASADCVDGSPSEREAAGSPNPKDGDGTADVRVCERERGRESVDRGRRMPVIACGLPSLSVRLFHCSRALPSLCLGGPAVCGSRD